jgi:hypothetical protein
MHGNAERRCVGSLIAWRVWLPFQTMNSAGLNMLLWLLLAVVALVGKLLFERLLTRAEERRALDAARVVGQVAQSSVKRGGPSSS